MTLIKHPKYKMWKWGSLIFKMFVGNRTKNRSIVRKWLCPVKIATSYYCKCEQSNNCIRSHRWLSRLYDLDTPYFLEAMCSGSHWCLSSSTNSIALDCSVIEFLRGAFGAWGMVSLVGLLLIFGFWLLLVKIIIAVVGNCY